MHFWQLHQAVDFVILCPSASRWLVTLSLTVNEKLKWLSVSSLPIFIQWQKSFWRWHIILHIRLLHCGWRTKRRHHYRSTHCPSPLSLTETRRFSRYILLLHCGLLTKRTHISQHIFLFFLHCQKRTKKKSFSIYNYMPSRLRVTNRKTDQSVYRPSSL